MTLLLYVLGFFDGGGGGEEPGEPGTGTIAATVSPTRRALFRGRRGRGR